MNLNEGPSGLIRRTHNISAWPNTITTCFSLENWMAPFWIHSNQYVTQFNIFLTQTDVIVQCIGRLCNVYSETLTMPQARPSGSQTGIFPRAELSSRCPQKSFTSSTSRPSTQFRLGHEPLATSRAESEGDSRGRRGGRETGENNSRPPARNKNGRNETPCTEFALRWPQTGKLSANVWERALG